MTVIFLLPLRAELTVNSPPPSSRSQFDVELRDFVAWLLKSLGCDCNSIDEGTVVCSVPESLRHKVECEPTLRLNFAAGEESATNALFTLESPLLRSFIDELIATQRIGRAMPASQPESVREVSQKLFDTYTIDGGSVHLGGCTLEDRALLRVTYVELGDSDEGRSRLRHEFVSLTGAPIEASLVNNLGLFDLIPPVRSIRVTDDQCDRWRSIGETTVETIATTKAVKLLLITVVWCKFAEGKLSFVIGNATTSIAFSGWAQLFVDGHVQPPPLTCPSFPEGSYHLAATDDGRIAPVEAMATCAESGKRVLSDDLELCEVTREKALPEYFATCPASGKRLLRRVLVSCETCQQLISPTSCEARQCSACRTLGRVSKDDPRMARILGEYSKLDAWPKWRLAETSNAYVAVASSLTRRLLIVVDKNNLAVLRLAKGSHFSKKWNEATEVDRAAYLR